MRRGWWLLDAVSRDGKKSSNVALKSCRMCLPKGVSIFPRDTRQPIGSHLNADIKISTEIGKRNLPEFIYRTYPPCLFELVTSTIFLQYFWSWFPFLSSLPLSTPYPHRSYPRMSLTILICVPISYSLRSLANNLENTRCLILWRCPHRIKVEIQI